MSGSWIVVKRILWVFPVAFGVVTLTFFLARIFGGDPVDQYLPVDADDQLRATVRRELGLDKPIWDQYIGYLLGILQGDFGTSFETRKSVTSDLLLRMPATIELAIWGLTIGVILGLVLGVIGAAKKDGFADQIVRGVVIGGMSIPSFWIGLVLIFFFAVVLQVMPGPVGRLPIGMSPPQGITGLYVLDSLLVGDWSRFWLSVQHLMLPAITLGIGIMAPIARVTRTGMVEALQSDYTRTAVAMGYPRHRILFRYSLKNAMLPVITMLGEVLAFAIGGALLVEAVFAWPGLGAYALHAINKFDFGALQGFVVYTALIYVFAYLLVDLLYMAADPRTRTGLKGAR